MAGRFVLSILVLFSLAGAGWNDDSIRTTPAGQSILSSIERLFAAGKFSEVAPFLESRADNDNNQNRWDSPFTEIYADMATQASDLSDQDAIELSAAFRRYFDERDNREARGIAACQKLDLLVSRHLGKEHSFRSFIRITIAEKLALQGKYSQASLLLTKNLDRLRQSFSENNPYVAKSLELIGLCDTHRGRYRRAESTLRKAIVIFHSTVGPEHKRSITCTNHLAYLLTRLGKYQEATRLARKVVKFAEANYQKSDPELIKSYLFLGGSLQGEGKLSRAEQLLSRAFELATDQQPNSVLVGSCLSHQGICLRLQGRHRESEAAFQTAFDIYSKANGEINRNTAVCLWNLAQIQVVREKYAEATPNIEKLIKIQDKLKREANHDQTLGAHRLLIQCQRRQGIKAEGDRYLKLLNETLESSRRRFGPEAAPTISVIAKLARFYGEIGKKQKSIELLKEGLAACQATFGDHHADTIGFHRELGHLCFQNGQLEQAQQYLTRAADSFEATREGRGFTGLLNASAATRNPHLPLLAVVLAKQEKFKEAWRRLEQSTSRALLDDLVNQSLRTHDATQFQGKTATSIRLHTIERTLRNASYSAARIDPNVLNKLKNEFEDSLANLRAINENAALRFGVQAGGVFELERIQRQIPDDTALVSWVSLRWRRPDHVETWACVIRNTGDPHWMPLNFGHRLKDYSAIADVSEHLDDSTTKSNSEFDSHVKSSADSLLGPIRELLSENDNQPNIRNLIVTFPIPFNIPLEVLSDEFRMSYTPSATIFAWLKEYGSDSDLGRREPSLLAVADPTFGRSDRIGLADPQRNVAKIPYAALPGTRAEVQALAKLFDDRSHILAGDEASELRLHRLATANRLKEYAFIHFATHGEPNATQPFQSSLILANDEESQTIDETLEDSFVLDSRLTASEMLNHWKLDAELVTLSACDTLRGKHVQGEYYLGFSQALLLSGTRSVVVSMWPVRDDATSLLMKRFYANMLGKTPSLGAPLGKAAALREAKQWLRQLTANELDEMMVNLTPELRSRVRSHRKSAVKKSARPFEHPYFWAPFILIGDPD